MTITYEWRGDVDNSALNELHAEGFGYPVGQTDWRARLHRHSLGWVCAWEGDRLVGFVNVAWDGGVHAFVLDTVVAQRNRSHGVGAALIKAAAEEAVPRGVSGCMSTSRSTCGRSTSRRVASGRRQQG